MVYLITAAALIVWLVLAWFIGSVMHITGASLWVLRGGLAVLGLACAGVFLWLYLRNRKNDQAADNPASGGDELDLLFRNAAAKLQQAGGLGRLPAIVTIGVRLPVADLPVPVFVPVPVHKTVT
jgi:hypothetical protein